MITDVTLYLRRGLHRQRAYDQLFLAASVTPPAFALAVGGDTPQVFVLGVHIPVLTLWIAWNDTRPVISGRVRFWNNRNQWIRNFPGAICFATVFRATFLYAAIPGMATVLIAHPTLGALWTEVPLALGTTVVYTLLGVAFALSSSRSLIYALVFYLGVELNLAPRLGFLDWFSPSVWLHTLAGEPSAIPIPAATGVLLATCLISMMWAGAAIVNVHRREYSDAYGLRIEWDEDET